MAKPILLYTSIWEETAKDITEQILEYPEGEPLDIWMNTPGGSITSGWSIIAALNERNIDVNYTIVGDASSFGFIMLLFGKNNKAYDTSNFLFHRAASWAEDWMNEDELKDVEQRNKVIRKKLESRIDESIFIEVTGKSFDDIFDMDSRIDVRLNAQQAKKIGLIDSIVKLDSKKRQELESRYFADITALEVTQKQLVTNKINNKMGKLTDLIFGEKDSLLVAQIGDSQFVYTKLEKDAKIKAIGKDAKPISGTFEADNKQVTVVENVITAISDIDKKDAKILALEAKIETLENTQITAEDIAEVILKLQEKQDAEIAALKADFVKAKVTVSSPKLPVGEFKGDKANISSKSDYDVKKEIEARQAERQAERNKRINGGI